MSTRLSQAATKFSGGEERRSTTNTPNCTEASPGECIQNEQALLNDGRSTYQNNQHSPCSLLLTSCDNRVDSIIRSSNTVSFRRVLRTEFNQLRWNEELQYLRLRLTDTPP